MSGADGVKIHPTAIVEAGVTLGAHTSVWDNAHLRGPGTSLGVSCIVGGKTYVAGHVTIGERVKLNANVYICSGVTLDDGVMVAAGVIFTNDVFPRATTPDLTQLRRSEPDEDTRTTLVCEGATIGAGAIIGCDLKVGRFAMIGMGSVVTRTVPDFALLVGNPGRVVGYVDRRGQPMARFDSPPNKFSHECADGYIYELIDEAIVESRV